MKKFLILAFCATMDACGPNRTYSNETCGKYLVTCVYNAGYGKNEFIADSVHQKDEYEATIFIKGKATYLGCEEIVVYFNDCKNK